MDRAVRAGSVFGLVVEVNELEFVPRDFNIGI